jgi:hypothetical protein
VRAFASLALLLLLLLLSVPGCSRLCSREEPLAGLDGGAVTCVLATDCPRPANVLVCGSPEDRLRDCVDCTANRCARHRPEVCE